MRKALWTSIALIFVWPCGAWSAAEPLELKVKDEVLLAKAMEGGMTLTLPEFLVFTRSGTAVFHDKGFDSTFTNDLERAMHSSTPVEARVSLRDVFADVVRMDGSPTEQGIVAGYDFVFVEYWADWCAPCHQQKRAVAQYLAENPGKKILWLYIRRDPTLLPGASAHKSE